MISATLVGVDARASLRAHGAVAPELEDVCIRATALAPGDRFRTVAAMREAIERYLDGDRDAAMRRAQAEAHLAADRFTVADKIEHLLAALPMGCRVSFETLFSDAASRVEVIVTFLAVLELMKLNQLMIEQEQMLGEIIVIRSSGN